MFRQAGIYNLTRTIRSILKRYRKELPSLTMHLYSAGFRLGTKDSNLHAYDGEMKHWMDCIREQKMPNELLDVLDELGIRFYDGCLIVEVHDHRSVQRSSEQTEPTADQHQSTATYPHQAATSATAHHRSSNGHNHQNATKISSTSTDVPKDQVSVHRLVLTPTCETLWRDILLMNEAKVDQLNRASKGTSSSEFKWGPITEEEAVELEGAILDRTTPALCLSPSIITSRIANQMLSETTLQPSTDKKSRKRPLNSGEKEAMRRQRERQERYMHIADESYDQAFAPTFSRIDMVKRLRTTRPLSTAPKEVEKKWNRRDLHQEQFKGFIPMTVSPSDLYLPGYSIHDFENESHQIPNPAGGSSSRLPSNSGRAPTPPLASADPPATTVLAPGSRKSASKKKAVERSETGSPAPGTLAPPKKPLKKPKKLVDMTPEAAAQAEEKRKKQAEQRKIQKERRLALAAAAKAEAAQKTATTAANNNNNLSTSSNMEISVTIAPPVLENSIIVPNRDQSVIQATEYHQHQHGDISINVSESIPVVTGDSIPVPNQFANLPTLSNRTSPAPNNGMPVHQELNTNSSSIIVPTFTHSIPVPSSSHHNSIPVHQGIPVTTDLLPMTAPHSIPVPSTGTDINCIPVPNVVHHQTIDQHASIPVPQSQPQIWNPAFANFRAPPNHNDLHQRPQDVDIDVHRGASQIPAIPSLTSIDVPNISIHPHPPHPPVPSQPEQRQQQQYHQHQQSQQQQQQQQQLAQQQQPFHNWPN